MFVQRIIEFKMNENHRKTPEKNLKGVMNENTSLKDTCCLREKA